MLQNPTSTWFFFSFMNSCICNNFASSGVSEVTMVKNDSLLAKRVAEAIDIVKKVCYATIATKRIYPKDRMDSVVPPTNQAPCRNSQRKTAVSQNSWENCVGKTKRFLLGNADGVKHPLSLRGLRSSPYQFTAINHLF